MSIEKWFFDLLTLIAIGLAGWAFKKIANLNDRIIADEKNLEAQAKTSAELAERLAAALERISQLEQKCVAVETRSEERMRSITDHVEQIKETRHDVAEIKSDMAELKANVKILLEKKS